MAEKIIIDRDDLYDLYINQKMTSKEIGNIYNCTSKTIRNWLYKYNIPVRQNGEAVKLERTKWSSDKELARSRKFHNTWMNKPQEERDLIRDKKTILNPNFNSPESILKANNTRINNKTTKISKSEESFLNKLLLMGFERDDIIHPYFGPHEGDNRYPFNCDFYIKSKDLFIEYQGHQTHGYEPYDENNPEHIKYLVKYQDKGYDMSTWFKRDPIKLKTAIENNVNLVIVYPKNKTYLVKNGNIETIDINDINKI